MSNDDTESANVADANAAILAEIKAGQTAVGDKHRSRKQALGAMAAAIANGDKPARKPRGAKHAANVADQAASAKANGGKSKPAPKAATVVERDVNSLTGAAMFMTLAQRKCGVTFAELEATPHVKWRVRRWHRDIAARYGVQLDMRPASENAPSRQPPRGFAYHIVGKPSPKPQLSAEAAKAFAAIERAREAAEAKLAKPKAERKPRAAKPTPVEAETAETTA